MTIRELQETTKRNRDAAGRAYVAQRTGQLARLIRRESDSEIREAVRLAVSR